MTIVESTAVEVIPPNTSLVRPVASVNDLVVAQKEYQDVCVKLLDASDIQTIGKKSFKKRSAWNKLAVAFSVSTTEVRTTHERDERGRIIRTECVVRATAPNGRMSDGIGACDLYERCCDPDTCNKRETWEDSGRPTGHIHCSAVPCKQAHFSNPQHDIPATAFTRASNRAKADLFGSGEVSAEEVEGGSGHGAWGDPSRPEQGVETAGPSSITRTRPGDPGTPDAGKKNVEPMLKRIRTVTAKLGLTWEEVTKQALGAWVPEDGVTFQECRKMNDWLTAELEKTSA